MEGFLPKNIDIDHKNKCKTDNRWVNLRLISRQCNIRNCKVGVNNTSGVTGVSWDGRLNKWTSQIHLNLKKHHLGCSNDFNEAVLLRLAAEECLDWNLCNSNSSAYLYAKKHKLIKF